jgi:Uncharacterized conserved protein
MAVARTTNINKPGRLIAAVLIFAAIFFAGFFLPLREWLQMFSDWINGLGVWGAVLFAGLYVIATVALMPGTPFTIAAGFVFGLGWGFLIVIGAAMLSASLAFLAARYLVRDKVQRMIAKRPGFKAADEAMGEEGWKIVMLLRLSPLMPFNVQNYFFGLTAVEFWPYIGATTVSIVPGALLYLYLGAIGQVAFSGAGPGSTVRWVIFAAGLVATLGVAFLAMSKAKAKLQASGMGGMDRGWP